MSLLLPGLRPSILCVQLLRATQDGVKVPMGPRWSPDRVQAIYEGAETDRGTKLGLGTGSLTTSRYLEKNKLGGRRNFKGAVYLPY